MRAFYDAVQVLLDAAVQLGPNRPAELTAAAVLVEKAWERITIVPTKDGKRAECSCSEKCSE